MIAFLHPAVLAALPLALLPLWLRARPKLAEPQTVPFAATRLLVAAAVPAMRHRRHRDWLVAALRVAMLALVVLGFARPYWSTSKWADRPGGTAGVTILAEPHQFIDAALAGPPSAGPDRLVFLGPGKEPMRTSAQLSRAHVHVGDPSVPVAEFGVRVTSLRTGEVTIADGPYFHPALAGLDDALREVVVRRWWRLVPIGRTFVIARLSNGDPFLVEHWSRSERGNHRTIVCASAADLAWTDLPVHPGFVPLVRGLVSYLATTEPIPGSAHVHVGAVAGTGSIAGADVDIGATSSRGLFGLALALAIGELALTGFRFSKLLGLVLLLVLVGHPQWRWPPTTVRRGEVWRVVDETDSMTPRRAALARAVAAAPPGPAVTPRGDHTPLGDALLALTNRPVAGVILFSDGQHNAGVGPALAALALDVPVFTVAVGPAGGPSSNGFAELRPPGVPQNLEGGAPRSQSLSPSGLEPLEGGAPRSQSPLSSRFQEPIRVYLDAPAPNWEFRHVRHALQRDAGIELVETNRVADVVLRLAGETWRWERYGAEVFQRYWSERVRAEYRARHPDRLPPPFLADPALAERTRLWRNDTLLEEIARVSGGRLFTEDNLVELPAALRAGGARARPRFDLRDSWLVLLGVAGLFLAAWLPRRFLGFAIEAARR